MELFLNDFYFRREFSELKKLFLHFREGTCKVQKTIASIFQDMELCSLQN